MQSSRSKASQSGLATFKREFGEPKAPTSSPEAPVPWSSSPAQHQQPPLKKLTDAEVRLQRIEAALQGNARVAQNPPLATSKVQNKRPSLPDDDVHAANSAPKRSRVLPPSWNDSLSSSSFSSRPQSSVRIAANGIQDPRASSSGAIIPPDKVKKLATVFLSQEQTAILKLVEKGDSVFYTGSAGTGKSVLLREIIKVLRKKFNKTSDSVAITASTGIAACNIGGVTIHSFAGIGLGTESAEDLVKKVKKNKKSMSRWLRTQVLIVDEVSMLDGDLFDKLALIASKLRKSHAPFGGIQIIVTGDFFQLPPVTKGSAAVKFAFEADMWKETLKHTFNLTKVFRQSDQAFVDMLNEMRFGQLSKESIQAFRALSREVRYDDGIIPTELFPRREDVERSNWTRMNQLETQEQDFIAQDGGSLEAMQREKMLNNFMAPKQVRLRVDAQVMLIKNHDETLVNGTVGRILRFVDPALYGTADDPEASYGDGSIIGSSQSVASVAAAKKTRPAGAIKKFPVVEFAVANQGKRRALVLPELWKVELPNGDIQCSRSQVPLILSWAMSIHKSQGQTLDRVKVDLGKVFEKGQAYVALSRATSLEGLQVLNFEPSKVQAHPKVIAWSKTLSTIDDYA